MKMKTLVISLAMVAALAVGCAKEPAKETTKEQPKADTVAAASVTDNVDVFARSLAADGKWIICTTKDLTTDKELVLDGDLKNGKKDDKGVELLQRKIALYTQDENKKVTARFTLTAPKLTVKSAEARIQGGTFKGDVYVESKNFQLVDATIDGNIYFASQEAMDTFKMTDGKDGYKATVTGKKELKK